MNIDKEKAIASASKWEGIARKKFIDAAYERDEFGRRFIGH